jgi:hypothetical protein
MRIYATTLAVPAGTTASSADAELIRDALWAHGSALGDIEHITVTILPSGIGIAVFLNQLADNPEERVMALLRITARRSPVMSRWRGAIESEANCHVIDDPAG